MKKVLSIVLALVLLVTLFGCQQKSAELSGSMESEAAQKTAGAGKSSQEPLTVLVDLAGGVALFDYEIDEFNDVLNKWLISAKAFTGVSDIELEIMPTEGAERSSRMTRLRTEMMAGQGPDVFIVAHTTEYDAREDYNVNSSIFLMPEKSMNLGLFYPLDDFIENARFMEWDKLNQTVMAAGYSEEYGQVLLPLCYEFPVTLFPKSLVQHTPSAELTWEDMLNDETKIMQAASSFLRGGIFPYYSGTEVFGQLADYKNKTLLFTEEEVLQRYQEIIEMDDKQLDGGFDDLPVYFKTAANHRLTDIESSSAYGKYILIPDDYPWDRDWYMSLLYRDFLLQEPFATEPLSPDWWNATTTGLDTEVTMIPVYSDDGGVAVSVRAFAAINANSKRGEDAFAVLDYLFGWQCMRTGKIYDYITRVGLPVRDDLWEDGQSIAGGWALDPANYEELNRIKECITTVTFADTISLELNRALWLQYRIEMGYETGDPAEAVHKIYTRMKRELSE